MASPDRTGKMVLVPIPTPEGASKEELDALFIGAILKAAKKHGVNLGITLDAPAASAPSRRPLPKVRSSEITRQAGFPPNPAAFPTRVKFLDGLRHLHRWAGSPSLRELEQRAIQIGCTLPKSSAGRILAPDAARLPSEKHLIAFVLACGVNEHECRDWLAAREQALADRPSTAPGGQADVFVLAEGHASDDEPAAKRTMNEIVLASFARGSTPATKQVLSGVVLTEQEARAVRLEKAAADALEPKAKQQEITFRQAVAELIRDEELRREVLRAIGEEAGGALRQLRKEIDKPANTTEEKFWQAVTIAMTADGFRPTARGVAAAVGFYGTSVVLASLVVSLLEGERAPQ